MKKKRRNPPDLTWRNMAPVLERLTKLEARVGELERLERERPNGNRNED